MPSLKSREGNPTVERSELISDYIKSRSNFTKATGELVRLSVSISGSQSPNGRAYWSSVLIAKLGLTAMTLDKTIPFHPSDKYNELWDFSSIATLCRNIIENYLLMFWLCVETQDAEVWSFRICALTIADNRSRYRLTAEIEGQPEPDDFKSAQEALAKNINNNAIFKKLSPQKQKQILKGDKMPFIQDEIIDHLDVEQITFRKFYRYLSSFVHTGTISFFRAETHSRSNGSFNFYESESILACMAFTTMIIEATISDLKKIHFVN